MEQAEETVTVGYQPPAPCFSSQHLFHWRQCTQCPWLLSTLEFGYRLQFKLECLRLGEEGPFISLLPNPSFLPKVLLRSFVSRPLVLKHFHPPPHNSAESARLHLICPVRALRRYISCTQQIRHSNQLFICYGDSVQAKTGKMGGQADRASLSQCRDDSTTGSGGPLYKRSFCLLGIV